MGPAERDRREEKGAWALAPPRTVTVHKIQEAQTLISGRRHESSNGRREGATGNTNENESVCSQIDLYLCLCEGVRSVGLYIDRKLV